MLKFEFTACFYRYKWVRVSGTVPPYCRRGTLRGYLNIHTDANAFFTMFEFPPEFYPKADDRGGPFGDKMMPYEYRKSSTSFSLQDLSW